MHYCNSMPNRKLTFLNCNGDISIKLISIKLFEVRSIFYKPFSTYANFIKHRYNIFFWCQYVGILTKHIN